MNEMVERVAQALFDEAMREPTEAMIEAAGSEHAAVPPREAWHDMIDEALR